MVKLFCYPVLKLMEVKLSPLHPSTIHQGGLDKRLYFTRIKNDTNMDSADSRPLVGQIEMRCNKPETSNPQSLVFLFLEGLKSSDHDKFLWGQCHARQQWLPRTWHRSGFRIGLQAFFGQYSTRTLPSCKMQMTINMLLSWNSWWKNPCTCVVYSTTIHYGFPTSQVLQDFHQLQTPFPTEPLFDE